MLHKGPLLHPAVPSHQSQEGAEAVSPETLLLLNFCHPSSSTQEIVPQSATAAVFRILIPKRSWGVIFSWFLCGQNTDYQSMGDEVNEEGELKTHTHKTMSQYEYYV